MCETQTDTSPDEQLNQAMELAIHEFSQNVEGLRAAYRIARESTLVEDDKCFEAIKDFLLTRSLGETSEEKPGYVIRNSLAV